MPIKGIFAYILNNTRYFCIKACCIFRLLILRQIISQKAVSSGSK